MFFWRFKQFGKFLKKVTEGHATVVGSHATVGWLSNNVFWTFQAIRKFFEKGHWMVTRQWSEVTRPSADCSNNVFWTFQAIWNFFEKSHRTVTRQWSEVTRPSADCQTTFFGRFKQFGKNLKKVTEGHATVVGGHATVGWLSNNVFWTFQAFRRIFEKSHWMVTRQWSEVTRPLYDCQTTFFDVSSNSKKFWKKSLNGHATVVGGHATVGWLSNNVFWRFKLFGKNLKKVIEGHATVVGGHETVVWLSNNVFRRFKQFGNFLRKVTEGHATVVGGHATVGWLSNNVF